MRERNNLVINLLRRVQALETHNYEEAKKPCDMCQVYKTISGRSCPVHSDPDNRREPADEFNRFRFSDMYTPERLSPSDPIKPMTHQDCIDLNNKIEQYPCGPYKASLAISHKLCPLHEPHVLKPGKLYEHKVTFNKQASTLLSHILQNTTVESFEVDTTGQKVEFKGIAKKSFQHEPANPAIEKLAQFIVDEVPGEPSQSEGAVDTAIRIIQEQQKQLIDLKSQLHVSDNRRVESKMILDMTQQFVKNRDGQLDWCKTVAENNPDVARLRKDSQMWSPAYQAICKLRDDYERLVLKGMTKPRVVEPMQAQPEKEPDTSEKPLSELEDAYYQQAELIQTLRDQVVQARLDADRMNRMWRQSLDALARLERTTHQAERNSASAWKRCRIAESKLKRLRRHHSR